MNDNNNNLPYVNPVPRGSKTASQPKIFGPLAWTIVPSVLPSNKIGSVPEKYNNNQQLLSLSFFFFCWEKKKKKKKVKVLYQDQQNMQKYK